VRQSTPGGCGAAASHYTKICRSQFYNYLSQLSAPKSAAVSITLKSAYVTTPKSAEVSSTLIFSSQLGTMWRRCKGCLKLHVISRKKSTNYRALSRKMTYKEKASYDSTPPCSGLTFANVYPNAAADTVAEDGRVVSVGSGRCAELEMALAVISISAFISAHCACTRLLISCFSAGGFERGLWPRSKDRP